MYTEVKWDVSTARPVRPYIFVRASHAIKAGEEIILDYGPGYWQLMARTIKDAHSVQWHKAKEEQARLCR